MLLEERRGEGWWRGVRHFLWGFFVCFVLKTECRCLKQKSVAIGEERFVSLPVDLFFFFVLRTECRCLKQKSVARGEGWLKCLFLYLWVFCFVFEDGMQIPETKVCC